MRKSGMSETTFNQDFEKVCEEKYQKIGFNLDDFEALLLAYQTVMEKREPYATRIIDSCKLVHDSIEN